MEKRTVKYEVIRYDENGSWAIVADGFTSYDEAIKFIAGCNEDSNFAIREFWSL